MKESVFVTRKEFADILGVSVRTVDRMRLDGRLPKPAIDGKHKYYWTQRQVDKVRQRVTNRDTDRMSH